VTSTINEAFEQSKALEGDVSCMDIKDIDGLRSKLLDDPEGVAIDEALVQMGKQGKGKRFWALTREALGSKLNHTGHIVMASSRPFRLSHDSTGRAAFSLTTYEATVLHNVKDRDRTSGIMEWYRRFTKVVEVEGGSSSSTKGGGTNRKKRTNARYGTDRHKKKQERWVHIETEKRAVDLKMGQCRLAIGRLMGKIEKENGPTPAIVPDSKSCMKQGKPRGSDDSGRRDSKLAAGKVSEPNKAKSGVAASSVK